MEIINGKLNNGTIERFDSHLIPHLGYEDHIGGRQKAIHATGVEIRFKYDSDKISFSFDSDSTGHIIIYAGSYSLDEKKVAIGHNEYEIIIHDRFLKYSPKPKGSYPSDMLRIIFGKGFCITNFKLDCGNSENNALVKPKMVAYGSSFTEGVGAFSYDYSYVRTLAKELEIDILNKGLSGNCLCEQETAKYLASIPCDYYLLELGMNMRGMMDEIEFEKRVTKFLDILVQTQRKIFIISSVDFFKEKYDIYKDNDPYYERNKLYSAVLHRLAKERNIPLIPLIELINQYDDISADMLHPSTKGHIKIGLNLAKHLKTLL